MGSSQLTMVSPFSRPQIVFGCLSFSDVPVPQAPFTDPKTALPILDYLPYRYVRFLDTARDYPVDADGGSERLLGELGVGHWGNYKIDTKVASWEPGSHTAEKIASSIDASLKALKMCKVNVMYLGSPDRSTPFEIACRAMDKAYREEKFKRFGLSNYTAKEMEKIMYICDVEGLVKPSVYQGKYNALIRSAEEALFPVLEKHKISFYAYSPSAAGLFSGKVTSASKNFAGSRWDTSFNEKVFEAVTELQISAKAEGLNGHAVGLRWLRYHSMLKLKHGDKIIIGASSLEQCKENLQYLNQGPLSEGLVKAVDDVWTMVKDTAPPYYR